MKTLLFDETASPTNNNFQHGLNVTVRRGTKYAKSLDIDEVVEFKNLAGDKLGEGPVKMMFVGPIQYVPNEFLKLEHDPKCRTHSGLIEVLQNCYGDPNIDFREIVTAIALECDFQRG